jgi:alpha,alpha-trehalose-phosphate synthase [UDP-forming]/trehalose-phosphatase
MNHLHHSPHTSDRPIVIAANRLPVMRTDDGWAPSPGGLVRALLPMLRETGGLWLGWTGDPDDSPEPFEIEGVDLYAVPISADEVERYYEGFSNDGLWPLYHDALRESTYDSDQWEAYVTVNERFAMQLAEVAPPNATVWVHDYQLQLVPAMLRRARPDVTIGFFLHIPFPPFELFSRLPWRDEIIEGLLGCDLIGFQTSSGVANFAACAQQLLDLRQRGGVIEHSGQRTRLGVFPISIDIDEVEEIAAGRSTRQRMSQIRARLGDPEVILLGVDRLDYTKGIGLRLRAFAALLESGDLDPEQHVLVQVATPTREGVEHYQDERFEIERLVGEINGRYSRIGLPVIHYLYQSLAFDELIALYRAGDVMLVTPFRDGMNLVAKEYAAAHIDGDGVLVLSEFAGAAEELTDAVLVNPHDDRALQQAIRDAVAMHRRERRQRMAGLRDQIRKRDVRGWAADYLTELAAAGGTLFDDPAELADRVAALPRPLLIGLDVDGVLAPIVAHPDHSALTLGLLEVLATIAAQPGVHVAVLSGRTVADLARFEFPSAVDLVGSHGMETADNELRPLDPVEHERLDTLRRLAIDAAEGAGSGAWVEHKPASVVLHVRQVPDDRADAALGTLREAAATVEGTTAKEGSEVLELFTRSANKGDALDRLRSELGVASTVYVGDDVTDEDAFVVLGASDVTVKVGHADTVAVNRLHDTDAVAQWLHRLAIKLAD